MGFFWNFGCNCQAVNEALKRQEFLLKEIIMNQDELLVQINEANAITTKIIGEIQTLKTAMESASNLQVSPEVENALAQLMTNLKTADDQNADVAPVA